MDESAARQRKIEQLVGQLSNDDAIARQGSREELIELGGPDVTRALVAALIDPRMQVRWEAAKALQVMADPVAAPALMNALDDEAEDVRWVAAEGLVALKKVGLMTVLSGLIKRARSIEFCKSAHHVLRGVKTDECASAVAPVLKALEQLEPEVAVPPAAYQALIQLNPLVYP
jgi:HEAT repeat protein